MNNTMKLVRVGEIELHVADHGSGEPILFVHGFPLDHTMWHEQIQAFGDRYRLIAPDLRGFGKSQVTAATATMEQYADDLALMLDALRVGTPVILCGLSMGGYVGWQFWKRHRPKLRALIQCDTRAAADTPEAAQGRLTSAEQVLASGPAKLTETMIPRLFAESSIRNRSQIVDATRATILATHRDGIAAGLRALAGRSDMTSELPSINVPTLAICGTHDVITPVAEMREVVARMPQAKLVEIADAGHMAPLEQPAAVNSAIREFLNQL